MTTGGIGESPTPGVVVRRRLDVSGTVQGVGFRPFVHALATELGLSGLVANDAHGVVVEVEGPAVRVDAFTRRLRTEAPALADVEVVAPRGLVATGETGFVIRPSDAGVGRTALVPPDVATCAACLAEVFDATDRRAGHAFANCTDCGPRFSIVRDVPYDRANTTMAGFAPCEACAAEYADAADRRFHAQPVCCPDCGPTLTLRGPDGQPIAGADGDAIGAAASRLRDGQVLAVKGIGGYHLAVDATHPRAVAALRGRKHRAEKPFAVMVADLDAARALCHLDDEEVALLTDPARPIVLARRRLDARPALADAVAPRNREVGVLLPYTPLHHLLLAAHGGPVVLTSGNVSDEPIAYRDDDAAQRLGPLVDAVLTHDRPIHVRVEDSVARVVAGRPALLRRARGYAPRPIGVPWPFPRHVLGVGAQLKSTVALARDQRVFVSPHLGDLEDHETFTAFTHAIDHLRRLFDVAPEVVAHDLHPEYLSTEHALALEGVTTVGVQHHHAHIASCLADNQRDEPVIGVAFDGTGYGSDGTVWGGEFLVADLVGAERVAHLQTVPLPGGAAAIREPWRVAASWLRAAYGADLPDLDVRARHADRWDAVLAVAERGLNSPPTSSVGRLFDAVAALLGIRDVVTYEGQAAVELEQAADPDALGSYEVALRDGVPMVVQGTDLIRGVLADLRTDVAVPVVAGRFHRAVADVIARVCGRIREDTGLGVVALSGGVFQNRLLVERVLPQLEAEGFDVLTHRRVPCNDGGISLGQVAVAAARERAGR